MTTSVFFAKSAFSQFSTEEKKQLDSLNAIISDAESHDTIKALTYLEIADYFYLQFPDTAIILCEHAAHLSELQNFTRGKADSYSWLGYLVDQKGEIHKALEYYHKCLKIEEELGNKEGMARSLNNIGMIYNDQGDVQNGLAYYYKSLKIEEGLGNTEGIAISLNNLGMIYMNQGSIEKSLEYFHKSMRLFEELGTSSNPDLAKKKSRRNSPFLKQYWVYL